MHLADNLIGIYEKAIPNAFDWDQKLRVAKQAGYDFIEISVDESDTRLARLTWTKEQRNNLVQLLQKHDMFIPSMCLSGHRRFPFGSHDEHTRNKAKEIMKQAIHLAKDLGISNIQLAGYDVYYEESNAQTLARFIDGLRYAATLAEENDVMLTIEIMDTYLCGTISRAMEFVRKVDSPNLKVYPDLGNLTQWSDDPAQELIDGFAYIEAIHLKDTKPGVFKCVPFGEGTVNFSHLFKTLTKLQYAGPFLVEMWANNDTLYTEEQSIEEIREARRWLQARM